MADEDLESFWKVVRAPTGEPPKPNGRPELTAAEAIEKILRGAATIGPRSKKRPSIEIMQMEDGYAAVVQNGPTGLPQAKTQPTVEAALESTLLTIARAVVEKIREHRAEAEDHLRNHHREIERVKALEGVVEGLGGPPPPEPEQPPVEANSSAVFTEEDPYTDLLDDV